MDNFELPKIIVAGEGSGELGGGRGQNFVTKCGQEAAQLMYARKRGRKAQEFPTGEGRGIISIGSESPRALFSSSNNF